MGGKGQALDALVWCAGEWLAWWGVYELWRLPSQGKGQGRAGQGEEVEGDGTREISKMSETPLALGLSLFRLLFFESLRFDPFGGFHLRGLPACVNGLIIVLCGSTHKNISL
jgi:hypothetical protein